MQPCRSAPARCHCNPLSRTSPLYEVYRGGSRGDAAMPLMPDVARPSVGKPFLSAKLCQEGDRRAGYACSGSSAGCGSGSSRKGGTREWLHSVV